MLLKSTRVRNGVGFVYIPLFLFSLCSHLRNLYVCLLLPFQVRSLSPGKEVYLLGFKITNTFLSCYFLETNICYFEKKHSSR